MKKLITILLSVMVVFTMSVSMSFADEVDARINSIDIRNDVTPDDSKVENIYDEAKCKFKFDIKINKEVKEGDHFDLNLSKNYDLTTEATYKKNFEVTDSDGEVIGTVDITPTETSKETGGGVARVTFNDKVKNKIINNINLTFCGMFNRHTVKGVDLFKAREYEFYADINKHYKNHVCRIVRDKFYPYQKTVHVSRELNDNTEKATWYANIKRTSEWNTTKEVKFLAMFDEDEKGEQFVGRVLEQEVEFDARGLVTKVLKSTDVTDKVEFNADRTRFSYTTPKLNSKQTRMVFESSVDKRKKQHKVYSEVQYTKWYGSVATQAISGDSGYWEPVCTKAVASITRIVQPEPEKPVEPQKPTEPTVEPAQPENPRVTPSVPNTPSVEPNKPSVENNKPVVEENKVDTPKMENKTVSMHKKTVKNNTPKTADTTNWAVMLAGIILPLIALIIIGGHRRKQR